MEDVPAFFISVEEAGKIVCEILKRSDEFLVLGIAGDRMNFAEQATILTKVIRDGHQFHPYKVNGLKIPPLHTFSAFLGAWYAQTKVQCSTHDTYSYTPIIMLAITMITKSYRYLETRPGR